MLMRPAKCEAETKAKADTTRPRQRSSVEAKAKNLRGRGRGGGGGQRCRINYILLIFEFNSRNIAIVVMIVSNDNVNAIALPYVWQLTDNYGYTHYYLQTNTLSQMVAIHSWPDFDDLPRGHKANLRTRPALHEAKDETEARWGRDRGRGQKIWPWGRVGLENLTSL